MTRQTQDTSPVSVKTWLKMCSLSSVFSLAALVTFAAVTSPAMIAAAEGFGDAPVNDGDQSLVAHIVDRTLTPYLTTPQRRDREERVVLMNRAVQIWRLEGLIRGDVDRKLCAAARSLLLGRLNSSLGIQALFNELSYVDSVELILYRVKTNVTPNLDGAYEQTRSAFISARMSISRDHVQSLTSEMVNAALVGSSCIQGAKSFLSDLWVSEKVTQRRERLRDAAAEVRAYRAQPQISPR